LIALASPWVKRGYISTVHYQLTSLVGAIDRLLGLPPISDLAAEARPLDDLFTDKPDYATFTADPTAVVTFPFVPLPGIAATADPAHGVFSFAAPDLTDPVIANRAAWMRVTGRSAAEYARLLAAGSGP
jgi:hypothetical protein